MYRKLDPNQGQLVAILFLYIFPGVGTCGLEASAAATAYFTLNGRFFARLSPKTGAF